MLYTYGFVPGSSVEEWIAAGWPSASAVSRLYLGCISSVYWLHLGKCLGCVPAVSRRHRRAAALLRRRLSLRRAAAAEAGAARRTRRRRGGTPLKKKSMSPPTGRQVPCLGASEGAADGQWLDLKPTADQCVAMAPLLRLANLSPGDASLEEGVRRLAEARCSRDHPRSPEITRDHPRSPEARRFAEARSAAPSATLGGGILREITRECARS